MIQASTIESTEGDAGDSISLLATDHSRFAGECPSSLNIHFQAGPEPKLVTSTESISKPFASSRHRNIVNPNTQGLEIGKEEIRDRKK